MALRIVDILGTTLDLVSDLDTEFKSKMSLQAKLQQASSEFQNLQADLSKVIEARQRLEAQLSENELVKKEFATLAPENTVYKLIGPVLVKQDQAEAKSNVDTRLDFIRSEIRRVEGQIKEIESKQEKKKAELAQIQTALQQASSSTPPSAPITV